MANKLPREIARGVFWIGDCLAQRHKGKIYHGYNAAFLIAGESASCLVETGHPKDFPVIEQHINELFARGVPPLKYLFHSLRRRQHYIFGGRAVGATPLPVPNPDPLADAIGNARTDPVNIARTVAMGNDQ